MLKKPSLPKTAAPVAQPARLTAYILLALIIDIYVQNAYNSCNVHNIGVSMINIAAGEARANFGELMDTAQREPISIEKHGRPVAVLMSAIEYEQMKSELLKARINKGIEQLNNGEYSDLSVKQILQKAKNIHAKKL